MPTTHLSNSTSYLVNKFEHVRGVTRIFFTRPGTGAFTFGPFTGRGQGQAPVWRGTPCEQTYRHTQLRTLLFATPFAGGKQWLLKAQKKLSASQFHNPIS